MKEVMRTGLVNGAWALRSGGGVKGIPRSFDYAQRVPGEWWSGGR